jgi:hypothetical protein
MSLAPYINALQNIENARKLWYETRVKLRHGTDTNDVQRVKAACEKGWQALVEIVDALLLSHGFEAAKDRADRRLKLKILSRRDREVAELGIYDKVEARKSVLYDDCLRDSNASCVEIREELDEVAKLINLVKDLIVERLSKASGAIITSVLSS